MMRQIGVWALAMVSFGLGAGCGDETDPSDGGSRGDGGSGAGGSPSQTTTTADGSTTSSGMTTGSTSTNTSVASSSTGGEPCDPLKNADDPTPTPGHCDGDVAVTCGQDGFLSSERCGGGTECREYELSEWRFNGMIDPPEWEEARTVEWAACLPADAEGCPREWNGNYYHWVDPPHCEGVSKIVCLGLPAPDLFSNYPQLTYGGLEGYLSVVDCPNGEKCAGSDTLDQLTCIDEDTPPCDGTEPSCNGDGIEWCAGTWESLPGYKILDDCSPGLTCYEGTAGPFCGEPGEVPCDEATFTPVCETDASAVIGCYQGWTFHSSCATCYDSNQLPVPCRCDDLATASGWTWSDGALQCMESHSLACVPQAAADCDPDLDVDVCVGSVAHRCVGHWEDVDCGAEGLVCDVVGGRAGCRAANAPACTPGAPQSCNGDEIVSCCACDGAGILFGPTQVVPCVSGYEVRTDCGDLGGQYTCDPPVGGWPWAECVYMP